MGIKKNGERRAQHRRAHPALVGIHNGRGHQRGSLQHAIAACTGPSRSSRHLNRLDPVSADFLGRIELLVHCLDEAGGFQVGAWRDGANANADGDALIQR